MTRWSPLSITSALLRHERPDISFLCQPDWLRVIAFANAHLITPAVYTALAARKRLEELPPEVRDYLALMYHANLERNRQLLEQLSELTTPLNARGIRPMLLKGTVHFFSSAYDDIGSRIVGDIDLLVPECSVGATAAALEHLGYAASKSDVPHTFAVFRRPFAPAEVDLHVSPLDPPSLLPARNLLECSQPIDGDGLALCIPSPLDRLMHAFLHSQIMNHQHYHGIITLRDLLEFARLGTTFYGSIDWSAVPKRLQRHGLGVAMESYALSAHRFFGMPLPAALRPSLLARMHHKRSGMQLRYPELHRWIASWGTLRAVFARHHLVERYGDNRLLALQAKHCARVLRTRSVTEICRMLRSPDLIVGDVLAWHRSTSVMIDRKDPNSTA